MQISPNGKYLVAASDSHNALQNENQGEADEERKEAALGGSVSVFEIDQKGKRALTVAAKTAVPTGCDITFV